MTPRMPDLVQGFVEPWHGEIKAAIIMDGQAPSTTDPKDHLVSVRGYGEAQVVMTGAELTHLALWWLNACVGPRA